MKWWSETLTASVISTAYECETAHLKRTTTYLLSSRIKWTTAIMQISMVMDSSSELQIVVYLYSSMNWTMSGISVWIFFKFCWCSNSTTLYVCVSLGFFFGKRKSFRIQRMFSFQSFLTRSLFEVIFFLAIFWLLLLFFSHIFEAHSECAFHGQFGYGFCPRYRYSSQSWQKCRYDNMLEHIRYTRNELRGCEWNFLNACRNMYRYTYSQYVHFTNIYLMPIFNEN